VRRLILLIVFSLGMAIMANAQTTDDGGLFLHNMNEYIETLRLMRVLPLDGSCVHDTEICGHAAAGIDLEAYFRSRPDFIPDSGHFRYWHGYVDANGKMQVPTASFRQVIPPPFHIVIFPDHFEVHVDWVLLREARLWDLRIQFHNWEHAIRDVLGNEIPRFFGRKSAKTNQVKLSQQIPAWRERVAKAFPALRPPEAPSP